MSTIRNRRRVRFAAVLFVNLCRIDSVPELPLPVRTRFGDTPAGMHGAMRDAAMVGVRWRGLVTFSGAGAPSDAVGRLAFELVATTRKSDALFPLSIGNPAEPVRRTIENSTEATATDV